VLDGGEVLTALGDESLHDVRIDHGSSPLSTDDVWPKSVNRRRILFGIRRGDLWRIPACGGGNVENREHGVEPRSIPCILH
ncbi:MAG: hypothetical protein ACYTDY_16495, partial [Planctomycetota bacterium]